MEKFSSVFFWIVIIISIIITPINSSGDQLQCYEESFNQHYTVCTIYNLNETSPIQFKIRSNYINPSNLLTLRIIESTINFIPFSIFDKCPYLRNFEIIKCGIKEIGSYSIKSAQSLEKLNFSGNFLTNLEKNIFPLNTLKIIDLSYNKIESIHENTFLSQSKLEKLFLSNNNLKELHDHVFSPLTSIIELNLCNNQIKKIDNLFIENYNMVQLNLSKNNISLIEPTAFLYTTQLKQLDISYNHIEDLDLKEAFIEKIIASNNYLRKIEFGKYITNIDLSNNNLTTIVTDYPEKIRILKLANNSMINIGVIENMLNLIDLDLSFNKLSFNISSFSLLQKLIILNLEATNLKNIDFGTFSHQQNLNYLDISYNNLTKIDFEMFSSNHELITFYIDGNSLTELSMDDFGTYLPNIKTIGLSDNFFNCSHLAQIVKKLNTIHAKIEIPEVKYVRNDSNVRGIFCSNEKNMNTNRTFSNPNVHSYNTVNSNNNDYNYNEEELILIRTSFNNSMIQNKALQSQLEEVQKNSSAIIEDMKKDIISLQKQITDNKNEAKPKVQTTADNSNNQKDIESQTKRTTTPITSISNDINFNKIQLQIDGITNKLDEKFDKVLKSIDEKLEKFISLPNKKKETMDFSNENIRYHDFLQENKFKQQEQHENETSVNHLSVIKIILVLIFILGLVFIAFKFVIWFFQNRRSHLPHHSLIRSNTMTTIDEHNI